MESNKYDTNNDYEVKDYGYGNKYYIPKIKFCFIDGDDMSLMKKEL